MVAEGRGEVTSCVVRSMREATRLESSCVPVIGKLNVVIEIYVMLSRVRVTGLVDDNFAAPIGAASTISN